MRAAKLCHRRFVSVGKENAGKLHFALGEGSGFVGKEDVHTACGFNADRLANKYAVARHALHIGGKHHRNHHGEPLGNAGHKHAHRQGKGVQQVFKEIGEIG